MSGKVKKVEILKKMKLKMRLEYSDKTPFFELKLFFQRPLENFLWTLCTCSRYLKGLPNRVLCVCKKIVTARHNNTKILTKKRQKTRFLITSIGTTVGSPNLFFHFLDQSSEFNLRLQSSFFFRTDCHIKLIRLVE